MRAPVPGPRALLGACAALLPVLVQADEAAPVPSATVVITATMTEQSRLASPAFTTVLTAEDIAKSPVNSLPDLLRDTVGVTNNSDLNGRDEIQIRGLDGSYTLILVNGKRVSSSGALWRGSDFDLGTVPLGSIERVEIVRGPMSALYGSDAIGGVVNIITKRPTKAWSGQLSSDYRVVTAGDQGDQWRLNATAAGALSDAAALTVSGEIYDRKPWYQHSADDPTEAPALQAKRSVNLLSTLALQLDGRHSLDIDLGYNHDKRPYGLDGYVYYPAWNYESYSYSAQQIERTSLALTHNGSWSWGRTFTSLKHERSHIDDYDSDYDDPQQRDYREINTYLRSFGVVRLDAHALTAGVDVRSQQIRDAATYLDTGKISTRQAALFAQDELKLGERWQLTLGGRLDHHPDFGSHFSPKAYLNYFVSDGIVVKGGASTAFKAPEAYQLSQEYRVISCGGSCYLSGNPALTPEKDTSFELGVELLQPQWNLSAVLFHNKVRDMIVAVYDASVPSRQWQNIAQAKTQGLELDGSAALGRALTLKGNLTLLKTSYTDASGTTVKLENRPERKASLGLDWRLDERFSFSLGVHHVGKQYYEEQDLPAYTRADLGAAARFGKALTVRAGIKNLSDVNLKDKNEHFIANELGRNIYLSAAYTF